jgi:hypothetical protein
MKGYLKVHYGKSFWQSNKKNRRQLLVFLEVIVFGHILQAKQKILIFSK